MTTPSAQKITPTLSVTLERDAQSFSTASHTPLSLLEVFNLHTDHYPFAIGHLMLIILGNLYKKTQETITAADKKRYEALLEKSKKRLPPSKTKFIHLPPNQGSKTLISWDHIKRKKIKINPNEYLTLEIKSTSKKSIEIAIQEMHLLNEHSEATIIDFARIICACTRDYTKAMITIDPACFNDSQAVGTLILYLYAYQKIQNTLAKKAKKPISEFSVQLRNSSLPTPSEQIVNRLVQSILEKDSSLKSLYENETPSFEFSIRNA